uniref:Uncharacterized protein n=1 Tax=Anguilla anguilla TaxID=7936 RepID=A0A0E9PK63_ANGAN
MGPYAVNGPPTERKEPCMSVCHRSVKST